MINVAIMGYGVVGSGVAEIITTHKESLTRRAKEEINIKYILDIREFPEDLLAGLFTKSFEDIVNDPEVKIVVEVMGGVNPAFDFVKACLLQGKSVVTSNKELVATKGAELLQIAKDKNVNFLFEASVGGGIPIIRPINQCLAANEVSEIAGILNGTTNFILTKMIDEGMSFEDALALAQKLGYAERNPSADVDGHDACRKICILASLAYGKHVYPESVHTEGITKVTLDDVAYAAAWGGVIKLIGSVKKLEENGKLDIFVAPMFVQNSSQLAGVNDVFNGIMVRGDATGDVVFYGKGAGKLPTASAVVADVIDCVKHINARKYLFWADGDASNILPYENSTTALYIRAAAENPDNAMENVKNIFGDVKRLFVNNAPKGEFAFVTGESTVKTLQSNIEALEKSGVQILSQIRIGDL